MSEESAPTTEASMCEIIGWSSTAKATRFLIDEDRHPEECWKHAEGDLPAHN